MKKSLRNLLFTGVLITSLFIIFIIFSFYETIKLDKLYMMPFCIRSECLSYFSKEIDGIVLVSQAFGWFLTLFVTVSGVIIALTTYISGVKSSNLNNYTTHITMFRDFANLELNKQSKIHPECVDLFLWYKVMFPLSSGGNIAISEAYKSSIRNIIKVVENANEYISDEKKDYKYKVHQRSMMLALREIGINLSHAPKNDFIEIESRVFSIIDKINLSFGVEGLELSLIQRKYI